MPTVRVEGAVNAPGSVLYREGAGLDYYVENAGGYARNADKGRVSVRYAHGGAAVEAALRGAVGRGDDLWIS
ncbi:MAG: SLBB domain-containing protein [Gemmatimonadetes bacterium]|nr:SLBB domain-containing protein [Gemmatimonadota bacterium]